jgi:endoglycosylceramidase
LAHAGRWITDAQGRVVILHGMNMVYKLPPYEPAAVGFGADDAAFLAAEGYNTVRVGVLYEAVEPSPGVYDDAYLESIQSTVDTLGQYGIVSLLDFHQDLYTQKFGGEGLPAWATEDDGLPAQPQLNFTLDYFLELGLNAAFGNFWHDNPAPDREGLQEHYAKAWQHVAARFAADHNVLGYELFNEPWPGLQAATCVTPLGCPLFDSLLTTFYRKAFSAIRQIDPHTLVWYEPNVIFNNGANTSVGAMDDAEAGFAFHDYCLQESLDNSNLGCDVFDNLVFAEALNHVDKTGDAILMTEFGATEDVSNLEAMVERADGNMVGWQYWAYCDCGDPTTSAAPGVEGIVDNPALPLSNSNLSLPKLQLLSRGYPQAIAGTPKSYGFDAATRVLTLDYLAARAAGKGSFAAGSETDVALPLRQYPQGYTVKLQGAAVLSAAGAPLLRLVSLPGAAEITLTVNPL